MMAERYKGPRPFVVEGINDVHVVGQIFNAKKAELNFGFYEAGSDDKVLKKLRASLASPQNIDVIGVMLDADNNANGRWQSIKNILEESGYDPVPDQVDPSGTIIEKQAELPKVGVWIMPNNISEGMLEDFCQNMVAPDAIRLAEKCVDDAKKNDVASFKTAHRSKAIIHTYLAWQDEPGRPLGMAIKSKLLDVENDLTNTFFSFLDSLYR